MKNPERKFPMNMEHENGKVNFPAVVRGQIGSESIQTVNARDLHGYLDVGKVFAAWITERIIQYGFVENQDYVVFSETGKNSSGGRPAREYHISLDMAKELSMVERNEKGKEARQYFIRCERKVNSTATPISFDPNDPVQLRGLLVNYAERTQIAENRVIQLEPKAEAFDRLEASEGSVVPRVAAKMLDIAERKFFRWLEVNSWFYRQGGKGPWLGYADRRKQGYVEHEPKTFIDGNGDERTTVQVKITPKGLTRLAAIFAKKGDAA